MDFIDYYQTLGIDKQATAEDIKKPTENWPGSSTRISIPII
jgi:hypothetical protein